MADEKKDEIQLKRGAVTISAVGTSKVCSAQETVTWKGGSAPIIGLGAGRTEALVALDVQLENLKKILGVS